MSQMSDFLENTLVDVLLRGQSATINGKTLSWSAAPTLYVALYTANPSDSGGGTEVSGGSYARAGFGTAGAAAAAALTQWAGTQSAASTTASSGTGGVTSNNNTVTFPAPTANWGTITGFGIFDASTSGNLLLWGALTTSKTVNNGDAAPSFSPAALTVTFA